MNFGVWCLVWIYHILCRFTMNIPHFPIKHLDFWLGFPIWSPPGTRLRAARQWPFTKPLVSPPLLHLRDGGFKSCFFLCAKATKIHDFRRWNNHLYGEIIEIIICKTPKYMNFQVLVSSWFHHFTIWLTIFIFLAASPPRSISIQGTGRRVRARLQTPSSCPAWSLPHPLPAPWVLRGFPGIARWNLGWKTASWCLMVFDDFGNWSLLEEHHLCSKMWPNIGIELANYQFRLISGSKTSNKLDGQIKYHHSTLFTIFHPSDHHQRWKKILSAKLSRSKTRTWAHGVEPGGTIGTRIFFFQVIDD